MLKGVFLIAGSFLVLSGSAQTRSLDFYVNSGLGNAPILKDYSEQIRQNGFDSLLLNAERKPQVNGSGMLMTAPSYKGWGYDAAITNGYNIGLQATASQNLFTHKIYAPQYEELNIANQSISNSSKISGHELQRDITAQYLTAYSTFNQLTYNQSLLKLLKDEEPLLAGFVKQGIYRQTDFLAFQLEEQLQDVQVAQLKIQYRSDLAELNSLCGMNDTAYYELMVPGIAAPLAPQQFSPFRMQFRIDSLRIVNSRSLVDSRYLPRFGWFADAGLLSSSPNTFYRNVGFSAGLSFSLSIYDGRRKGLEYQKLGVSERIRMNYQQFFYTQQNVHILQLKQQLASTEQLIQKEQGALNISEQLMNANKTLLNNGQASVTDFILAVKSSIDLHNQLNETGILRLETINQLNYWSW